MDVFLLDAGELALELVGFGVFAHVEFRGEGADGIGEAVFGILGAVVVEELEEGDVVVGEAGEEGHGLFVLFVCLL